MRISRRLLVAALALCAASAHAHHVMDYELPATAMDGLLSGLGHPVIGIDHFLFIAGAGVLAARFERGYALPLFFVFASVFTTMVTWLGVDAEFGEWPVAASLVVLGAMMIARSAPPQGVVGVLFLAAGAIHGNALAEAIVGAEQTPLAAYLAGLAVIQCVVALAAWRATVWLAARKPGVPLQKLAGAALSIAGGVFAGMAFLVD